MLTDGLYKCPSCSERFFHSDVRGSGVCISHGLIHIAHDNLDIYCRECALSSGRCQVCGEKFKQVITVIGDELVNSIIKERFNKC